MVSPADVWSWFGRHVLARMLLYLFLGGCAFLALTPSMDYGRTRARMYNSSALSAGRSTKLAEGIYYQEHESYTSAVADLLVHDRNLTDDRGVTFIWSYVGQSNFTFTTTHMRGKKTFVYTE